MANLLMLIHVKTIDDAQPTVHWRYHHLDGQSESRAALLQRARTILGGSPESLYDDENNDLESFLHGAEDWFESCVGWFGDDAAPPHGTAVVEILKLVQDAE